MGETVFPTVAGARLAIHTLVPQAGVLDSLAAFLDVFLPTVAKGVILRRPGMVALAERLELDRRAIRRMQRLRDRYGSGPLRIRFPGRAMALVFEPKHVRRVLTFSPKPFQTSTSLKRAALAHFEPGNVLISTGVAREERRRFHEQALDADRPVHRHAGRFLEIVAEETARLSGEISPEGQLNWAQFADAWFRIVR